MHKIKKFFLNPAVDIFFRLAALISLGLAGLAALGGKNLAECQLQYNTYLSHRTEAIAQAAEQERVSERAFDNIQADLLQDPALLVPREDRSEADNTRLMEKVQAFIAATERLQQERQQADIVRAENPVPPPPNEVCDINLF